MGCPEFPDSSPKEALMKKKIFFMTVMVFSLFITIFSQATSGRGKMSGIVTDAETGKPIEGVVVKLYCVRARSFHTSTPKTDDKGYWKAMYLRGGMWNIDFEKAGYETKKITFNVETTPSARKPSIDIQMRKIEGPALADTVLMEIDTANRLLNERKFDEALKSYLDIMAKNRELSGIEIVNLYIGNCYAMQEKYAQAVEYYQKAIEKYPKNKELIISIGNAYNNMHDFDNAMKWFQKISFEEIDNVDTLYNIGVIYYNKAKYEEAIKYFKKATEVFNEFAEGFYQLGMTYTALNKIPEALESLKRFMELDPESPNYETAKAIVDAFSK
jgi:tetratricopeptide (TPR) repeat protein